MYEKEVFQVLFSLKKKGVDCSNESSAELITTREQFVSTGMIHMETKTKISDRFIDVANTMYKHE